MRPAVKFLFLWLILTSVNLGGLRQPTPASWGRPGGEALVSPSRSCSFADPNRMRAPTLRLLKYGCAPSSSSDQLTRASLRAAARVQIPNLRRAGVPPSRTVFGPLDPGRSRLAWSTGPPAHC